MHMRSEAGILVILVLALAKDKLCFAAGKTRTQRWDGASHWVADSDQDGTGYSGRCLIEET